MSSRYIVFAGYHYYPRGGLEDIQKYCNTLEEAKEYCSKLTRNDADWYQIFDTFSHMAIRGRLDED